MSRRRIEGTRYYNGEFHSGRGSLQGRTVATWLAGESPNRENQRIVSEMFRLFEAFAEVVPASQIGPWLDTPNPAFEGSTPLQVIERGESDRLWRMIWELRMGNSWD